MPVRLVIFDLDGTLVDTSADITSAINEAIRPLGLTQLGVDDAKALVGDGITRLMEKVLGPTHARHREGAIERFLAHYSAHLSDSSRAYPHAEEVLGSLKGIKRAVLSNKKQALSRRLLEELGLLGYFDLVAGSDTTPEKKPSPKAVAFVVEALGESPGVSVMVGDSNYDIEAGKAAGLRTVGVTYGYRDRKALSGADYLVDGLEELMHLFHSAGFLDERRKERRYDVPDIYRKYIDVEVTGKQGRLRATLVELSGHGLRLAAAEHFEPGSSLECVLTSPRSLSREVAVTVRVRHSEKHGDEYVTGAEIERIHSEVWFKVFQQIVRFISEREGEVF
jgi:phosphoglycolate phosphatase